MSVGLKQPAAWQSNFLTFVMKSDSDDKCKYFRILFFVNERLGTERNFSWDFQGIFSVGKDPVFSFFFVIFSVTTK